MLRGNKVLYLKNSQCHLHIGQGSTKLFAMQGRKYLPKAGWQIYLYNILKAFFGWIFPSPK